MFSDVFAAFSPSVSCFNGTGWNIKLTQMSNDIMAKKIISIEAWSYIWKTVTLEASSNFTSSLKISFSCGGVKINCFMFKS